MARRIREEVDAILKDENLQNDLKIVSYFESEFHI